MTGIWIVSGPVPVTAETVLPNGVVELIFDLGPPAGHARARAAGRGGCRPPTAPRRAAPFVGSPRGPGAATPGVRPEPRRPGEPGRISHKHLIARFHAEVGVAPSRLRRILRFDRLADDPAPDWATLAVESGFGDQSHLVREFHALAGVTPTTYLRTRLPGGEHLDASGTG